MFQERSGHKTRKAANSDKFYAEWAAHLAAAEEEDRSFEDIENDDEPDEIANDDQGIPVAVIA